MPKVFKVEKAFLSTVSKEDKSPQVVNTKGGEMHKYMVQFENQSIPGWIGILKKPGNSVSVGDEMYGVLEENQWNKPQFTRMQLPQDGSVQLHTASQSSSDGGALPPVAKSANSDSGIEAKLDYIISLLENRPQSGQDVAAAAPGSTNNSSDTDDIDLDELDY